MTSTEKRPPYDVLIVGSGAGGSPLALTLARAGLQVLVLERGPRYPRSAYRHDEITVHRRNFFRPSITTDPHVVVSRSTSRPIKSDLGWIALCVGGGTSHMGSYLYRFHPDDFRMASRFGAYEELVDWPYDHDDLEPYYCRAEREIGVSGLAGANPFEGPRSEPYPLPPLDVHPMARSLEAASRRRGLHPFPTPRGINSHPYLGRPSCSYCEHCSGYGCPTGARGSTQEALIPRAEATGRCEVRPDCRVHEVTLDPQGRATGCLYFDSTGAEHEARARIVCVCCSAIESARLLLLSKSRLFPDGLANGQGLVGRHLQFHGATMGQATFEPPGKPELELADPHPFLDRSLMDHYFLPDGVSDLPKGGLIRFGLLAPTPLEVATSLAKQGLWGQELKSRLHAYFRSPRRTVEFEVFHDYLPNRSTRMELDPDIRDSAELPAARIHLFPSPHHRLAGEWVGQRALEILDAMGAAESALDVVGAACRYLVHGTCRAGHDPETSVLNEFCQTHEVPNLFVVDGSFMPTSGGAAPTLTILANSFRVADHILERCRRGDFPNS